MINPFLEINWYPQRTDLRKFGRTMAVGTLVVASILYAVGFCGVRAAGIIIAAGIICYGITCFIPTVARPVYLMWFALGASVGLVVSNLLLMLFFYLVFSPMAWVGRKLFRRDPLCLKQMPERQSNWHNCEKIRDLKRYYKQY